MHGLHRRLQCDELKECKPAELAPTPKAAKAKRAKIAKKKAAQPAQ